MDETIQGRINKIIFNNSQNGYTIMQVEAYGEKIIVVGTLSEVIEGQELEAKGEYVTHKNYGRQFQAKSISLKDPKGEEAILKYLASGLLPGIGEKKAVDVVNAFGENTLEVLENEPERLCEIKGIGPKTALMVGMAFRSQREIRKVIIELSSYGISNAYAMKLYKEYGLNATNIVKENPYALIDDIYGIGFKRADEIALFVGIELDSSYRIVSGLNYCLSQSYQQGNTYVLEEDLINLSVRTLGVDEDLIDHFLKEMVLSGRIEFEAFEGERRCFLPSYFKYEKEAAKDLVRLLAHPSMYENEEISSKIKSYEQLEKIALEQEQRSAIKSAITSKISIITGGPGTGKTTIIKGILSVLDSLGASYKLAAPTGRAAKRMSEACASNAQTIHRLLEYSLSDELSTMEFGKNEGNLLDADFIIIDEMSMVDIILMRHFLKAVDNKTSLIFVGDVDQLPSVSPGNVLSDLIESKIFNESKLKRIFRQDEESLIVGNAHRINEGKMPIIDNSSSDFFFLDVITPVKIAAKVLNIIENKHTNPLKEYDIFKDIQIICSFKKGEAGVKELNEKIQALVNPPSFEKEEIRFASTTFRVGDKVMQIKNNYTLKWIVEKTGEKGVGIYNGDMGIISLVDTNHKKIQIIFDDEKKVTYDYEDIAQLILAYAITVHKSQGSEFKAVVLPIVGGYYPFLTRNLLYTALTRAKEKVILVGEKRILDSMIKNEQKQKRKCAFKQRIEEYYY